jgi:putative heme iron utilization protein
MTRLSGDVRNGHGLDAGLDPRPPGIQKLQREEPGALYAKLDANGSLVSSPRETRPGEHPLPVSSGGRMPSDHDVPGDAPSVPPPLRAADPTRRRTAAEEARTLMAAASVGALATLTADGDPWGSIVTYGLLHDGAPVLCVSRLAEHGRNLEHDPRASLVVSAPLDEAYPLAGARVTVAGRVQRAAGDAAGAARAAHLAAVPSAELYVDFGDFSLWVLRVERVRWVGGYGRMASADADAYAAAEADPVDGAAAGAVAHLNADHAEALLAMAVAFAGYTDATAATCTAVDRYGLDLMLETPRGRAPARAGFVAPVTTPGGLRAAAVELARRARGDRPRVGGQ